MYLLLSTIIKKEMLQPFSSLLKKEKRTQKKKHSWEKQALLLPPHELAPKPPPRLHWQEDQYASPLAPD
eukprot:4902094-Ditylum_brightwellii.AAC.1